MIPSALLFHISSLMQTSSKRDYKQACAYLYKQTLGIDKHQTANITELGTTDTHGAIERDDEKYYKIYNRTKFI